MASVEVAFNDFPEYQLLAGAQHARGIVGAPMTAPSYRLVLGVANGGFT